MDISPNQNAECKNEKLEIYTLGRFLVKSREKVLSEQAGRSHRIWDLFKYLVTHRNKSALPEVIIETLWPGREYSDPKRALRTPVYRLRQLLANGETEDNSDFIIFTQGCYKWNTNTDYWLDIEEFETLCRKGQSMAEDNPAAAADILERAVTIYNGDYLPECLYDEWLLPVRNYYRRIYLQSALQLCRLFRAMGRHTKIIKVCEKVFIIEPFEEEFHLHFLNAHLAEGRTKEARSHYEYVTSLFYRELGIKPSPALRGIYRQLKTNHDNVELDLNFIQESLTERQEADGAFFCDPDIFRFLYKLERRRMERTGKTVFLSLLTLITAEYGAPAEKPLREASGRLADLLLISLRKGDIVTHWNDSQFLMLLPDLNLEQGERVLKRITAAFNAKTNSDVKVHGKIQPLLPLQTISN